MLHHASRAIGGTLRAVLLCSLFAGSADAASYRIFYSFPGTKAGAGPAGPLLIDSSGALYGTTLFGGRSGNAYELSAHAKEKVLYRFKRAHGTSPYSGLIADTSGNYYGTTVSGGTSVSCGKKGCGTVFRIAADGSETVLHAFQGGSDGVGPSAGLVMDGAGNLYGTTTGGGTGEVGTIFKIAPDSTETILHSFQGGSTDGANPVAGLLMDASGNLYGTTEFGGDPGYGTVYELAGDGTFSILHSFTGLDYGVDGEQPFAGVTMDSSGNLYGTTTAGGTYGYGTVFKLAPDGTESVLHSFAGGNDGALPYYGVVLDGAGDIYGATYAGGSMSCSDCLGGILFKLKPDGRETVLHTFVGEGDGSGPCSPLIWNGDSLYGATLQGGSSSSGTIFEFKP